MMIFNQCIQSRLLTMVKSISSWHIICFFFRFNEWHHCLVCGAWPFVPPWLQYTFLRIDDINTLLNYLNNLGNMLASYVRARCAGQTLFVCSLHPNSTDREERRYFCPYEICTFLEGRSRVSGPNLWCFSLFDAGYFIVVFLGSFAVLTVSPVSTPPGTDGGHAARLIRGKTAWCYMTYINILPRNGDFR